VTAHIEVVRPAAIPAAARRAPPVAMVVFGASGDLTHRKLMPALFRLFETGALAENFAILGVSRRSMTPEQFRDEMREAVASQRSGRPLDDAAWRTFAESLDYIPGEFGADATYQRLASRLPELDRERGTRGNRLFYLATPPSEFDDILTHLKGAGLIAAPHGEPWTRVIIEKPFGRDLETARELNRLVASALDESQIFRIDHYLGKETVQNIMVFRFANSIFEPIWNRKYVDYVEICALETVAVEKRGKFYEQTGVLRDVVQNHLLEVLCLTAMEPPVTSGADDVRGEKLKVLHSLRPMFMDTIERDVMLGQYRGYRSEPDIAPDSVTPTFAALRVYVDNWRWQGVPFYLRSGKKLAKRITEISLHMQRLPLCLFGRDDMCERIEPNVLTLRIQPNEGVQLRFASKVPGYDVAVGSVAMDMTYVEAFGGEPPEAYERLLLDAMRGDATLFSRRDAVEASWAWVDPILEHFERNPPRDLPNYEPGSWGPEHAAELMRRDRRCWREFS
jgi:glucose-6-phosphate 1-dehydrogenase